MAMTDVQKKEIVAIIKEELDVLKATLSKEDITRIPAKEIDRKLRIFDQCCNGCD